MNQHRGATASSGLVLSYIAQDGEIQEVLALWNDYQFRKLSASIYSNDLGVCDSLA